jgi:hypothetical protein
MRAYIFLVAFSLLLFGCGAQFDKKILSSAVPDGNIKAITSKQCYDDKYQLFYKGESATTCIFKSTYNGTEKKFLQDFLIYNYTNQKDVVIDFLYEIGERVCGDRDITLKYDEINTWNIWDGGTTEVSLTCNKYLLAFKEEEKKLQEEEKIAKNRDLKDQCLEFGFKEGTEGFANCQLELTILANQSTSVQYDERLYESLEEISKTVKRNKLMLDKQTFDKMLNQSKNYSLGKCKYLWDC